MKEHLSFFALFLDPLKTIIHTMPLVYIQNYFEQSTNMLLNNITDFPIIVF